MKNLKLKLGLLSFVLFISLTSLVDNSGGDIDRIFMGVSADEGTIMPAASVGDRCYETTNAKQYFFWIRVDSGTAYRSFDCADRSHMTSWKLD